MKKKFNYKDDGTNLVMSQMKLIRDPDEKKIYAVLKEDEKEIVVDIDSKHFLDIIRLILSRDYPIKSSSFHVKEVHDYISSFARCEAHEEKVYKRYCNKKKEIIVNSANGDGKVTKITEDSVSILDKSPVLFFTSDGQKPLGQVEIVEDESQGLEELRKYFGNIGEDEFKFIICWIVAVIYTKGPFPILLFQGEQGSGKTFIMKIIRAIIDDATASIWSMPSNEKEFLAIARNTVVLLIDNVSELKPRMSDVICRAVSGGCVYIPKKFADDQEIFHKISCGIIIYGIKDLIKKSDLADRTILIPMGSISQNERKTEQEIWHSFKKEKPVILGAIYETIRKTMSKYHEVKLDFLPRMAADFAQVACAVASALGWDQEALMKAYQDNNNMLASACIEDDDLLLALEEFISIGKIWEGTATELLNTLKEYSPEGAQRRYWPSTPSRLTSRLNEAAPVLRARGIIVDSKRSGQKRTTYLQYVEN